MGTALLHPRSLDRTSLLSVMDSGPPLGDHILVADDHEDSRTIARLVLESAGYTVEEAATGHEALASALERPPCIILLDIVLPGIDGWDLARRLRADRRTRGAHIIAVTALAGAWDHARSLGAGCDEVLIKPIPIKLLLSAIQRYGHVVRDR